MPAMLQTSGRLLALLSLLQQRREWTGPELAGRLEVGPRTIRRDVDKLRELGYPIEAAPGVAGGYRLGAGAEMPPLLLDDAEAVAVAVGCAAPRPARSAASRRRRSARWPSSSRSSPTACAGASARSATPRRRSASTARRSTRTRCAARGRVPRRDAPALLLHGQGRRLDAARGRARRGRAQRLALVPRRLRPRPRRLAHVPRRPHPGRPGAGGRGRRREVPGGDAAAYVKQSIRAPETRDAVPGRVRLSAPATLVGPRVPPATRPSPPTAPITPSSPHGHVVARVPGLDGDVGRRDGGARPAGASRGGRHHRAPAADGARVCRPAAPSPRRAGCRSRPWRSAARPPRRRRRRRWSRG